jgi:hypothetical protein
MEFASFICAYRTIARDETSASESRAKLPHQQDTLICDSWIDGEACFSLLSRV